MTAAGKRGPKRRRKKPCGKTLHASKHAAEAAIRGRGGRWRLAGGLRRAYYCKACRAWHVSSKARSAPRAKD